MFLDELVIVVLVSRLGADGWLIGDARLAVGQLSIGQGQTEEDGRNSDANGDDENLVHVLVPSVDETSSLNGSQGVGCEVERRSQGQARDGRGIGVGQILGYEAWQRLGLDGSQGSRTTSATNLGEEEDKGSDHGDVLMRDRDLSGDLQVDSEETTTHSPSRGKIVEVIRMV